MDKNQIYRKDGEMKRKHSTTNIYPDIGMWRFTPNIEERINEKCKRKKSE
jgi:hypothetical protein